MSEPTEKPSPEAQEAAEAVIDVILHNLGRHRFMKSAEIIQSAINAALAQLREELEEAKNNKAEAEENYRIIGLRKSLDHSDQEVLQLREQLQSRTTQPARDYCALHEAITGAPMGTAGSIATVEQLVEKVTQLRDELHQVQEQCEIFRKGFKATGDAFLESEAQLQAAREALKEIARTPAAIGTDERDWINQAQALALAALQPATPSEKP